MITIEKELEGIKESSLKRYMGRAKKAVGLKGEVSVLLTSNRQMRQLNRCFRGKDKPTDVISFPAVDAVSHKIAGDLAISVDMAAANAKSFGHTADQEVRVLILHGLLHLAGYDHEMDKGEMARKEERLREKLGLPSNLIARTEGNLSKTKKLAKARTAR